MDGRARWLWAVGAALVVIAAVALLHRWTTSASARPAPSVRATSSAAPVEPGCPRDMARIAAATFKTAGGGSSTVAEYCLDRLDVTVDAYARCVDAGACDEPDRGGDCNWAILGRGDHPVNCVDRNQAAVYCAWARRRLPTFPEWQWAAHGSRAQTHYPWGNDEPAGQLCWSDGHSRRHQTCAAGSFFSGRSPDGIADLTGNVHQWTATKEPGNGPYLLGGWAFDDHGPDLFPWGADHQHITYADTMRTGDTGFRCAASPGKLEDAPPPRAPAKPSPQPEERGSPVPHVSGDTTGCPEGMVRLPPGAFVPAGLNGMHRVGPLCIERTQITVESFAHCVAAGRCQEPDRGGACNWKAPGREAHPINCISQPEAAAYCAFRGGRLPTEIEWQWAARGAQAGTLNAWGNEERSTQVCWSRPIKRRNTCPAGAFPAGDSPQGVSDLTSNVLEWTSTPSPRGVATFYVGLGGFTDTDPVAMQWSTFGENLGDARYAAQGARCVAPVAP